MSKEAYEKFLSVQRQLETDPEYRELETRRRKAEPGFLEAVAALSHQQREDFLEYFGILQEQSLREVELACFISEK